MLLPLDHFRLLGVRPDANSSEVETVLIKRLKEPPSEGYSLETVDARAEVLRASAILLMDEQRRQAHEQQLERVGGGHGFSGIELEPGQEIAAPLLLVEARENLKAFEAALELLSLKKGDHRPHKDLLLLLALAARGASQQMWGQRLYDQSAQILEQVIQLLEPHPSQVKRKRKLEDDLGKIVPFRVLELLSRENGTAQERQRGINNLKMLIDGRGGLDAEDDEASSSIVFQDFFRQIRPYLTIDEQLTLFEEYSKQGSSTAMFLLAYTRAAAGFQRHQPAQIDGALTAIEAVDVEGLEPEKACLLLLLGQPEQAQAMVDSCNDIRLCQWLTSYTSTADHLLGLCIFCGQWLEKHVLPSYRDVPPCPQVDLDGYFSDPAVQNYIKERDSLLAQEHEMAEDMATMPIEKEEKELDFFNPVKNPVYSPKPLSWSQESQKDESLPRFSPDPWLSVPQSNLPPRSISPQQLVNSPLPQELADSALLTSQPVAPPASQPPSSTAPGPPPGRKPLPLVIKSAVAVAGVIALVSLRPWSIWTTDRMGHTLDAQILESPPETGVLNLPPALSVPAESPSPSNHDQVQRAQAAEVLDLMGIEIILQAWLNRKSAVLSSSLTTPLNTEALRELALLAVPSQVMAVERQHQNLREQGEQLQVETQLRDVSLLSQTPNQVRARVELIYTETTLNTAGTPTKTLGPLNLQNDYIFTREQQIWKLLGFAPSQS